MLLLGRIGKQYELKNLCQDDYDLMDEMLLLLDPLESATRTFAGKKMRRYRS
jgi:hypothetical protein